MSRRKKRQKLEADLHVLELHFAESFHQALQECAAGHWGMFGQSDVLAELFPTRAEAFERSDSRQLVQIAAEIQTLRTRLGYAEPNALCHRYMMSRRINDSNGLGESRLATSLFEELFPSQPDDVSAV